jgi:drug/metabolite transporter (DMT)-like permease
MIEWYYLVLISSILSGLATLVEKNALKREYATRFSATVSPFVALVSLVFLPFASFDIGAWEIIFIIAWSALNAYSYLLAARAFRHSELSASSAVFSSLPTLIVVVLAFLLLNEQLSSVQYIGILGMIVATYMMFFREPKRADGKQSFESSKYKYVLLFAVVVSGLAALLNKPAISGINPYTFFIVSSVSMAAFFTLFITWKYKGIGEMVETFRSYRLPTLLASLLTSGYRLSYYLALVLVPVALAQPLSNAFYVIITVAIGGMIFKEGSLTRKLVLSAFLIFFAYLLTI